MDFDRITRRLTLAQYHEGEWETEPTEQNTSIKTSIGLLLDNVGPAFSPPLLLLLKNIQGSSLRLERLANDLIELTSLQSGRAQPPKRRIEVRELVQPAFEINQPGFSAKEQILDLKLPPQPVYLETDFGRIRQVLGHLLSNANKFSAKGKKIGLEVKLAETNRSGKKVIFSIQDEGTGIALEEQPLIFEKFYQSQVEENSIVTGTGLGLPLAKALVELNGGQLWFESEPGKGSTFYFWLPAL